MFKRSPSAASLQTFYTGQRSPEDLLVVCAQTPWKIYIFTFHYDIAKHRQTTGTSTKFEHLCSQMEQNSFQNP